MKIIFYSCIQNEFVSSRTKSFSLFSSFPRISRFFAAQLFELIKDNYMYKYLRLKFRIINYCFFQLLKNQRSNGKYGRLIGAGDFQANSREFSVCLGLTRLVFYPTRLKYGKIQSKTCANFLRYNLMHS